jgi:ATP-dependent Clp protease protease subunit
MENLKKFEKDFSLFARDHHVPTTTLEGYSKFMDTYIEPTIIEERRLNVAQISVFSRMFMERTLYLGTEINSDVANIINCQLLYLQADNPDKEINLYINSPGGSVYDGLSIYDVTNLISCPVSTTCCGTAASMAAVILSSGEKGMRYSLPNSIIMIHAPSNTLGRNTAPDLRIASKQMERCEDILYRILAENMGKDYDYVKKICDRDFWMNPQEALQEGLIDKILTKSK